MSASHTPGRYKVREEITADGEHVLELEIVVAGIPGYHRLARITAESESALLAEQMATFQLFAAAPDLLAALENAERWMVHSLTELNQGNAGMVHATRQARAAIARAKGGAA